MSADVEAAWGALLHELQHDGDPARFIPAYRALIEAAIRAAALEETRAAVEDIRPVWLSGPDDKSVNLGQVLAAIDALREDADAPPR